MMSLNEFVVDPDLEGKQFYRRLKLVKQIPWTRNPAVVGSARNWSFRDFALSLLKFLS